MPENEGGGEESVSASRQGSRSLMESSAWQAGSQSVSQFSWRLQWTERDEWALNDGRAFPSIV